MTKEQIQEYTLKITKANRSQIIVLVYDMALQYLEDSKKDIKNNDLESFRRNLDAARKCVAHLLEALDFSYEIAFPLMRLYVFINKQITLASIRKKEEPVDIAIKLLSKLRKSFDELAKTDTSEPLMDNTQDVYVGLTYGKGSLNENLSDNYNRGFMV